MYSLPPLIACRLVLNLQEATRTRGARHIDNKFRTLAHGEHGIAFTSFIEYDDMNSDGLDLSYLSNSEGSNDMDMAGGHKNSVHV
jgi:hypothetical protein